MPTIGADITTFESTAAAVTTDTAAVAAANTQLATDTTANAAASSTLKTDLSAVGGAAFSPDTKTVYLSDASTAGFHTVLPVAPDTEVPPAQG